MKKNPLVIINNEKVFKEGSKLYCDNLNMKVLPEVHPHVVDECLSRKRPVIIFEDISYIVRDKKGIFVSKRDIESFSKTLEYVIKNYYEIQKDIEKNKLPTKQDMLNEFSRILNE